MRFAILPLTSKCAPCGRCHPSVTAADPESRERGIREANMRPVWKNWLAIYYGWRERLSHRPRGKAWKLPYIPFLLAHWRYAGTSIFARE